MTESEWLACTDPERMIYYLRGKVRPRKWRSFARAAGEGDAAGLPPWYAALAAARWLERTAATELLREIVGNPFHRPTVPPYWPTAIVATARALHLGADCAFALHDALLDAGRDDLADHFHASKRHPHGCWVVDLILSK